MSKVDRILVIDDDLEEAQNHIDLLNRHVTKDSIEFIAKSPLVFKNFDEYLMLIKDSEISAVIIDQRLGEKSPANYTGLQLANWLRAALAIMPIFILTKYAEPDQLESVGGSLDDIIEKRYFHKNSAIYMTRLLRAVGRYKEASSTNRQRLDELLQTGFERSLTEEEHSELKALRSELMWQNIDGYVNASTQLDSEIELRKEILKELRKKD